MTPLGWVGRITSTQTKTTVLLNQWKGENVHRKYFMINLHKKVLLIRLGSNPQPPDHQSHTHPTEPLRPAWPTFHGPVISWCINIILMDYETVWPEVWLQNKYRLQWPSLLSPVILHCVLKSIWCINTILSNYESVWPKVWPKNKVDHSDLYFMVHWFCLISWRVFHV